MFSKISVFILMVAFAATAFTPLSQAQTPSSVDREVERAALIQQIKILLILIERLQAQEEVEVVNEPVVQVDADKPVFIPVQSGEHMRGDEDAQVQLVVYTDYDCPFCRMFHSTLKNILPNTFSEDEVVWVHRHFPLEVLHPETKTVSLAAECVAKYEGNEAFWEFSDAYFVGRAYNNNTGVQSTLTLLDDTLEELNFDGRRVMDCIEEEELMDEVNEDYDSAIDLGLRGVPEGVFVSADGEVSYIKGAQPVESVVKILEDALGSTGEVGRSVSRAWIDTKAPDSETELDLELVGSSFVRLTGTLYPPENCQVNEFQYTLEVLGNEPIEYDFDSCSPQKIDEFLTLKPFYGKVSVAMVLVYVDRPNNVWMNKEIKRYIVDMSSAYTTIEDTTGEGKKG